MAGSIEYLAEISRLMNMEIIPAQLIEQHPKIRTFLNQIDSKETASFYAALLLDKRLQSNCVRLEALVHLSIAYGNGSDSPTASQFSTCFNELGKGICGRMEDPAEDVFVSLVLTPQGNYRVLEGIWESGTFYLQRLLELVDTMPDEGPFAMLRQRVYALLRISEAICNRVGLNRYELGATSPQQNMKTKFCAKVHPRIVIFTREELSTLGLSKDDLDIFTLNEQAVPYIKTEPIQNSPLQRFPIIDYDDEIALMLPTAISYAIRTAIVDFLLKYGLRDSLLANLTQQYASFFNSTHLLGSIVNAPVYFSNKDGIPYAEVLWEDRGRHMHFVFFLDTFDRFFETGLFGFDPSPSANIEMFFERIRLAQKHSRAQPDFREGLSLLIHCGIGRGTFLPIHDVDGDDWNVQFLSAPDLCTLSNMQKFKALTMWRILESIKRLHELGVKIHANGLLNLIGWIQANDGNIINHSQTPKGFRRKPSTLLLAPNFVLELRRNALMKTDRLCVPTVTGEIALVRRVDYSLFPEDNEAPMYAVEKYSHDRGIPFVYLTTNRAWWCEVVPTESDRNRDYDQWEMLITWLRRIIPAIQPRLDNKLPATVLLRIVFEQIPTLEKYSAPLPTSNNIKDCIHESIDTKGSTVTISVGEAFHRGLASPKNVSERSLVMAICKGFASLGNVCWSSAELDEIEAGIVVSDDARHMHNFQARSFRDHVLGDLSQKLIRLDDIDAGNIRLGLAFRVESREKGRSSLRSKLQCTKFLNALVNDLEDEICEELRLFDRASFIETAFRNHEIAIADRNRWEDTANANLALHQDREGALRIIADHNRELNAEIYASRVLVELAICECSLSGGMHVSKYEFAKLMAKINAIMNLGGWSDSIHLEAMPPTLSITPLGDVQANTAFESSVLMPFAKQVSKEFIDRAVEKYCENYELPKYFDSVESTLDQDFISAWKEEFGFSINDFRRFVDTIEDIGIKRHLPVFTIDKAALVEILEKQFDSKIINNILDTVSLTPRTTWRTIPDSYEEKDIQPWRYRRQLSSVRHPLIQIDCSNNPLLLIAPGILRDSVCYIFSNYHEGSFPERHYKSRNMKIWCGKQANIRGSNFTIRVGDRIRELGWETKIEIKVSELLQRSFDQDYGDIDVLAWNKVTGRILAIECKDLHFHKTHGEIAEQLSDYRGQLKNDGKRDDLLKHIDRLKILRAHTTDLQKIIKCDIDIKIEGWIIFKNPVPMLYVWEKFEKQIKIATYDDLDQILGE
ncbi:MAG: hypothetical protein ABSE63_03795 [Thermoguttaceae bacterium]